MKSKLTGAIQRLRSSVAAKLNTIVYFKWFEHIAVDLRVVSRTFQH